MSNSNDDDLVTEVGLDSPPTSTTADYFRLAAGEKRRVSIVWIKADGAPKILSGPVQYFPGVGKVISRAGKDGPEADAIWMQGEPARTSYATVVLVYPKGADGKLDRERLLRGVDVLRWTFADKTFSALQKLTSAGPLGRADFWATCSDDRYQRMEFTLLKNCIWWADEEVRAAILRRVAECEGTVSPARKLTTSELAMRLGTTWPPQPAFSDDEPINFLDDGGSV